MAQYKGAVTKRGFNPKRVESQVSAINNQTNRTIQAMQQVRTQYAKNRANFDEQVKAGQRAVESQLDANGKIELQNAQNNLNAATKRAVAEENQQRQNAKDTKAIFDSLAGFSEQAVQLSAQVALNEKNRQDGATSLTDPNVLTSAANPAASAYQEDSIIAGNGLVQSAEVTGEISELESVQTQAQMGRAAPSLTKAELNTVNVQSMILGAWDEKVNWKGKVITVGEGTQGDDSYEFVRHVGDFLVRRDKGKINPAIVLESDYITNRDRVAASFQNSVVTRKISESRTILDTQARTLLEQPIQGNPEYRQSQISANYQLAIQKVGFPKVMAQLKTRYLDSDGNLIGPTAAELMQASIDAEGPGRPRMSPGQYAELQTAERTALSNFQQERKSNKAAESEKLWAELQRMPEFDSIDINNPNSENSRKFIASMRETFNNKDLPMPASARNWIRDIENGTKAAEEAKFAELTENPNSLEEDSYEDFNDPKLRREVYDLWIKKTKGGYGSNYKEIQKQFESKAADEAKLKFQPGSGERVSTVESRAIERRLNTIFRAKYNEFIKKYPDDPDTAASLATEATFEQWAAFKKRDATDTAGEYYSTILGDVNSQTGVRTTFPNLVKFDEQATVSRKEARDAIKLAVKTDGIQKAVETVSTKLKPRLESLSRRYEANPSDFTYPVEVTELAEITGKKPSDILNIMLEAADVDTIPDFEALKIIESDPELVKSMNNLYRTNVVTQRAGAYGSNTTSAFTKNGGGAVASLVMQGEGNVNSINRGNAGDTPGGSQEVFGRTLDQVSVEEIMIAQQDGKVFAVGKWQIIPDTMRQWVNSGHPSAPKANEMFTSEVQGRFWNYVTQVKRPAIGAYLNGETSDPTEAAQALAREFASVGLQYAEAGRGRGESRYAGTGGNVATIPPDRVIQALKQQRARNMGMTSNTSKEANATGLMRYRRNVVAKPVMELASGQPGLDIYFEDKQFPVVMGGVVKDHGFEKGYGNYTVIESIDPMTGDAVDVLYSHLAAPSNLILGSRVKAGDLVGTQGGTGNVKSIDGTIASVDFLRKAEEGSKSMVPYQHYDSLRRRVSSNLGHPQ